MAKSKLQKAREQLEKEKKLTRDFLRSSKSPKSPEKQKRTVNTNKKKKDVLKWIPVTKESIMCY